MLSYMLRSSGPDENTEFWLERDEAVQDFETLVEEVAKEVVRLQLPGFDEHKKRSPDRDDPMPWWGDVIGDVVEILCERHGFRMIEPKETFEREWSISYVRFCPKMDKERCLLEESEISA